MTAITRLRQRLSTFALFCCVVLASFLFAGLRVGGQTMQANVGVPVEIVLVIQALVVLFIAAPALVKSIFRVRNLQEASAMASKGWNG